MEQLEVVGVDVVVGKVVQVEQLEVVVGVDVVEDEVEVNIFVCVSVKIIRNCTFPLFFGHNRPEKVLHMCFIVIFSTKCFDCPGPEMEGGKK